jgi:uncharacterized protein YuzE
MIVELSPRGSAYIRYRTDPVAEPTMFVGGEDSEVLADVNDRGDIIGIEIVDVNVPESVQQARTFAAERGLEFPIDLLSASKSIRVA